MKSVMRLALCGLLLISMDALAQLDLATQQIAIGLSRPLYVTHAGDGSGRLFIVEQAGTIRIVDGGTLLGTAFLNLSSIVHNPNDFGNNERGLLGLAFHPNYPTDDRFFVNYTRASDGNTVVASYTVSSGNPNIADSGSAQIILTFSQPQQNHNGGHLAFGPDDGLLYISSGDGGGGGDDEPGHTPGLGNGQDVANLLGKILRIDIDSGSPYSIPAGNPFVGSGTAAQEIYAYGLRNPWRFSFDTGVSPARLYCADVGQSAIEEVDLITNGGNYGWRRMEGTNCFNPGSGCQTGSLILPIHEYPQASGRCSITGGYVYRGTSYPNLVGLYIYGDYCTGEIWSLEETSPSVFSNALELDTTLRISSFGEDEDGELYVCDLNGGTVYQLVDNNLSVGSWSTY